MFFKYRPAQVRDLPECRLCLRDHFAYDAAALDDLAALWRELISDGAANATVIEDVNRPIGQRIVYFCMMVFISGEYARYLKTAAPPFVGPRVVTEWRQGRSPLLTLEQIRRANSGGGEGVTMLVLNSGSKPEIMDDPTNTSWKAMGRKIAEYSIWAIGGYNLRESLLELYTDIEHGWAEGYGYRLQTDYRAFGEPSTLPMNRHPRLYGADRAEAERQIGTSIAELFHYETPCFFFTPSEQELLQCALFGDTDEELAEFLSVSPVTLKKRWVNIYERVAAVDSALLGSTVEEVKRGMEKKRRLLQYLRHHLEELRPVVRPQQHKT